MTPLISGSLPILRARPPLLGGSSTAEIEPTYRAELSPKAELGLKLDRLFQSPLEHDPSPLRPPGAWNCERTGLPRQDYFFPEPPLGSPPSISERLQLEPELYKAFQKLKPEDRKKFERLLQATQRFGGLDRNLLGLLGSGRLMARDREGNRVLDHLHQLGKQPLAPGVDRVRALQELAQFVNRPDDFTQDSQGTCTVTSVGRVHLLEDPADFARIIVGLTSRSGTVRTQGGDTIARHQESLGDRRSGRSLLERLYQDALMEFGNGSEDYSVKRDEHFSGNKRLGGGLSDRETRKVAASVIGRDQPFLNYRNGIKPGTLAVLGILEEIRAHQAQGKEMLVSLKWGNGSHALTVYKIEGGFVYLSNPWGSGDQGGSRPQRTALRRGGGRIRMPLEEFLKNVRGYQPRKTFMPTMPMHDLDFHWRA